MWSKKERGIKQEREEDDWIGKEREYKTTNTIVFNDDVSFTA
jgi:hypothetical protein